jgi:hypothetical protein
MVDIYALAKKMYNIPLSEILDELYKPPSAPPAIEISDNSIKFYKEVEFKAPQILSQDSGIKRSQLDAAVNNNTNTNGGSCTCNGLNLSVSDW